MVKAGFQAVKDFLIIASKSKKPSQVGLCLQMTHLLCIVSRTDRIK